MAVAAAEMVKVEPTYLPQNKLPCQKLHSTALPASVPMWPQMPLRLECVRRSSLPKKFHHTSPAPLVAGGRVQLENYVGPPLPFSTCACSCCN